MQIEGIGVVQPWGEFWLRAQRNAESGGRRVEVDAMAVARLTTSPPPNR
jgi:hypothetical protein